MLAVLKSGAAFCPLNLDAPVDRMKFIVEDVKAKVVLTISDLRHRLAGLESLVEIISVDRLTHPEKDAAVFKQTVPNSDSPAYVMYTSGSTGKPKGVQISHLAASQALLAHNPHIPKFKRFLQFASPTFDVSVFEIFFPLYRGATLVCSDRERLLSDLPRAINELAIDSVELTPTVAGTLLKSRKRVPNLKILLTIGEMLTEGVIREFGAPSDSPEGGILVALYGPTEATIHCTIDARIRQDSVPGNIGTPLATVSAFVLDYGSAGQPKILPVGHIGELAVGGNQLAHGYVNRPEQTEAAFVDLYGYGRVYRTGDKARLLPNGQLECLGRIINTQVKLRGQRVELGEIEQTAYRASGIDLAAASVIDGALVVFCSSSVGSTIHDVKSVCDKWLPRYMRPNEIIMVGEVPRLPSGKIDKNALERGYKSKDAGPRRDFENDLERNLARIIGAELGVEPSRDENLSARGLDSIQAIKVASKLRSEGHHVSVSDLLYHCSVGSIASLVQQNLVQYNTQDSSSVTTARSRLRKAAITQLREVSGTIEDIDFCTPMQNAMLSETVASSEVNCNWFEVDLGDRDLLEKFADALETVGYRNEIFRSGFVFVQALSTFARVIWYQFDKSCLVQVDRFTHGEEISLLRPLSCQLLRGSSRVLFHAHHAIFDGWTLDLLLIDLENALQGKQPLKRPSYQLVSDFYALYHDSEAYTQDEDFWGTTLASAKPSAFPTLCATRARSSEELCLHRTSRITTSELEQAAKTLGVNKPSIVVAAYAYLLIRYAGSTDTMLGIVSSGRTLPIAGIEHISGPCLNTLPLPVTLSGVRTVRDLILQCYSMNREALSHEHLPLAQIKQVSRCSLDDRFLDSVFVWQESIASSIKSRKGIFITESRDRLNFSLNFEAEPTESNLRLKMTYKTQVLAPKQAETFCKQLDLLLDLFVKDRDTLIQDVEHHFERHTDLISATNIDFSGPRDQETNLVGKLEDISRDQPQRPALEFIEDFNPLTGSLRKHALSYRELHDKADKIGTFLRSQGCKPDDLVAIWMEKSVEQYLSVLAVIKAGAGYLPLDPNTPAGRIRQILEEARVELLLSASTFEKKSDVASIVRVLPVDLLLTSDIPRIQGRPEVKPSDLAYAVFTSGTTGKPKGLLVTRKNIASNINTLAGIYPTVPDGKLLQACSPAFDVAVFEIFYTWHQGMCLVSTANDVLFRDYESFIQRTGITHLSLTPSVAAILDRSKVPGIKFLVTAGEALTQKVFRDWADGQTLYQGYGPAETTNICSVNPRMTKDDFINNIGPPFPNTSAFVIDDKKDFQILPRGFVGEFCFGGDQVCRGYLNAPELTAEKFINHPTYGWLYRSGDIGRMLVNGSLVSLGRRDDQVKIRGQRVELAEIDHAMLQQSYVTDCVTFIAKKQKDRPDRLVCFWAGSSSDEDSDSDISNALSDLLPLYMVPDDIIRLDKLPTTAQGKIDKRVLLARFEDLYKNRQHASPRPSHRPPTEHERIIMCAVAEVCNIKFEDFGPETPFTSLGLDSIKAIGLSRKLGEHAQHRIDVSMILHHSSSTRLARAWLNSQHQVENAKQGSVTEIFDARTMEVITQDFSGRGLKVQKILPCTPLQESMLSESASKNGTAYWNEVVMEVYGDLDQLKAAWDVTVQRQEILRACFVSTQNADFPFAQVVLQHHQLPWIAGHRLEGFQNEMQDHHIPPWSISVRTSSAHGSNTLVIAMHHCLYDAEAFSILLRDVETIFKQKKIHAAPGLESYLGRVLSARSPDVLAFWREKLKDFQPINIIDDLDQKERLPPVYITKNRKSKIPLSTLKSWSSTSSLSRAGILQAAWARLLAFLSSVQDICFGNVYSGRDLPGTEYLVAPCFNTLPLRIDMRHPITNSQLVKRLLLANLDILPHQGTSLRLIQAEQCLQSRKLFDTLLLVQNEEDPVDETIWSKQAEHGSMAFPLIFEILPRELENCLDLSIHANVSKLPPKFLKQLIEIYDDILDDTMTFEGSQCLDFSFLDHRQAVLSEYQDLPRSSIMEYPSSQDVTSVCNDHSRQALSHVRRTVADLIRIKNPQDVDPQATIFQLGLDSINAFQLSSLLRRIGISITAADILDAASIQNIAIRCVFFDESSQLIENFDFTGFDNKHRPSICQISGIHQEYIQCVRPCTKSQNGMLAHSINSKGQTYINSIEYDTDLPPETTMYAWQRMIEMHEMLRAGFVQLDDRQYPFAMVIYYPQHFSVPIVDDINEEVKSRVAQSLHIGAWKIAINGKRVHVCIHHALYDAQSLATLLKSLDDISVGHDVQYQTSLEPLLSSMLLADKNAEHSRSFWQSHSSDIQSSKFPSLHTHTCQTRCFDMIRLQSTRRMKDLETQCQSLGVTLQVVGQAAWATILSAYLGESNVTFGVVLSTRSTEDSADQVLFPCVNTLPVFTNVSDIKSLLESLSKHNVELFRWPTTPLSSIQRWVNISEALFDTVFVYQKFLRGEDDYQTLCVKDDIAFTEYALSIELVPERDGFMTLQLTFDTSSLPRQQAALLLQQYSSILGNIISADRESEEHIPKQPQLYSTLPPKENPIEAPVDTLHEFVERSSEMTPESIAFEFFDKIDFDATPTHQWTYRELNREGNKFANLLIKHGCVPGDLEKEFIDVPEVQTLAVDDINLFKGIGTASPVLQREIVLSDVCYCLYTSGTTGNPKGCLISHGNSVQAMMAFRRLFSGHWDENSRWLQFASFHFDVNILEHFFTWGVGMCLVSTYRDVLLEDLAGNIDKLGITHIDLTPSLARLVKPEDAPSLCKGIFITGGEQLKKEILDSWGDHEVIYNGYGPSEVTIGCTMLPRVTQTTKPSNIGPQFDNVGSYVMLPGTNEPVLRGGVGELCVTGPLVGIGYLNRPELTRERFPVIDDTGERMYRTGDLVRLLHDGSFDFLGRADDQVKLRGQRLEIGEINEVIRQATAQVHDVTTLVLKHRSQSKEQLASFIVFGKPVRSSEAELLFDESQLRAISGIRSAIHDKLPPYMIPSFIIPISRMPLSSNNKIDAKVLRRLFEEMRGEDLRAVTEAHDIKGSLESKEVSTIQTVLVQILDITQDDIHISSSFFELGLDSISAIGFAKALRDRGVANVHSSMIMKHSTVGGLAAAIQTSRGLGTTLDANFKASQQRILAFGHKHSLAIARAMAINKEYIEAIAPCTPLQAGLISQTIQSNHPVYHSTFVFELGSKIDITELKMAWIQAQQDLQILRTRFVPTEDGYAQVVIRPPEDDTFWEIINANSDSYQLTTRISDWKKQSATRLDTQPWRIHLSKESKSTFMHLSIFHGLYDGIGLDLLLRHVKNLYRRLDVGPYKIDFFEALPHGPLSDSTGAKHFWMHQQLPPITLQLEPPSLEPIVLTGSISYSTELFKCRNSLKVTEPAIFHAAWLLTLFSSFNILPTHGIVISGRSIDLEGAEDVIGPMFNTLPCFISTAQCTSFADLVSCCHNFNTSVLAYQHTPLRDIMKWKRRVTSDTPFDSLLVFQKEGPVSEDIDDLWTVKDSRSSAAYPLAVEIEQKLDGSFSLTLVAASKSIQRHGALQLLDAYKNTIEALVQDPQHPLSDAIKSHGAIYELSSSEEKDYMNGYHGKSLPEEMIVVRREVSILAEVQEDDIPPRRSIFELGLDSIDAIKLSARLKEAGLSISMSQIMRSRTIQQIAANCLALEESDDSNRQKTIADEMLSIDRNQKFLDTAFEFVLPTTPLQEGLVSNMVTSKFQQYLNHEILEVEKHIDLALLIKSWETVVKDNGILRTVFLENDDPAYQYTYLQGVSRFTGLEVHRIELEDEGQLNDQITIAQRKSRSRGLDQPMFSLKSMQVRDKRFLLLSMSHALYDGMSLSMLHHDVAAAYHGRAQRRPPYVEFIAHSLSQSGLEAIEFWKDQLNGVSPTRLPERRQFEPSPQIHKVEYQSRHSESKVSSFCKSQGVTVQTLGLACWMTVLAHRVGKLDICSGLVLSGRSSKQAEEIMFPTMNTVAFRCVIHGSVSDLLQYVQNTSAKISEYQHFPLRKARAAAGVTEQLFQSIFLYQRTALELVQFTTLYHSLDNSSSTEFPVNVEWEVFKGSLVFRAACSDAFFSAKETGNLLLSLDTVLSFMLTQPSSPVMKFSGSLVEICDLPGVSLAHEKSSHDPAALDDSINISMAEFSETETHLVETLSKVANVPQEKLLRSTSLFEIGLDSISAIKVSSLLRKKSLRLPVSEMMKALTIGKMAQAMTQIDHGVPGTRRTPTLERLNGFSVADVTKRMNVEESDIERILPATAGQEYMLQMWRNSNQELFYPAFYYELKGSISIKDLEAAWTQVCHIFPVLRTTFMSSGDDNNPFLQIVLQKTPNLIRGLDGNHNARGLEDNILPPVRLDATSRTDDTIIRLRLHHALYDAVSLPLICSTLEKLCNGAPAIPNIHCDIEPYINATVGASHLEQNRKFWTEYLEDTTTPSLIPNDIATQSTTTDLSRIEVYQPHLFTNLEPVTAKVRKAGLSIQSLFFAIYAQAYSQYANPYHQQSNPSSHLVIGVYLANRSHELPLSGNSDFDLSTLAAPTMNIVPLKIRLPSHQSTGAFKLQNLFELAKEIQSDLALISQLPYCTSSLHQIHGWTNGIIRIDQTVNFLKLPVNEDNADENYYEESQVNYTKSRISGDGGGDDEDEKNEPLRTNLNIRSIVPDNSWLQTSTTTQPPDLPSPLPFDSTSDSFPLDPAYIPGLDIEASITHSPSTSNPTSSSSSSLNVGIFGPKSLLGRIPIKDPSNPDHDIGTQWSNLATTVLDSIKRSFELVASTAV
ncbi:putative nonribosomal siderophore peptide synthase [Phaeomoniella chlamydospora]|uniref:Nonribosomal peptide synthetase sidC n=1 Tax=Phaeomoniella chlamydospora TaxID=158046 RepID=A0A0G2F4Q4_PHACM|nr:putative nonribosomal siderophore peptide synthase [Phaeomoniella chlamydospora]